MYKLRLVTSFVVILTGCSLSSTMNNTVNIGTHDYEAKQQHSIKAVRDRAERSFKNLEQKEQKRYQPKAKTKPLFWEIETPKIDKYVVVLPPGSAINELFNREFPKSVPQVKVELKQQECRGFQSSFFKAIRQIEEVQNNTNIDRETRQILRRQAIENYNPACHGARYRRKCETFQATLHMMTVIEGLSSLGNQTKKELRRQALEDYCPSNYRMTKG